MKFHKCEVKDVTPLGGLTEWTEIECDYRPAYGPVFEKLGRVNGQARDEVLGRPPKG